MRYKLIIWGFLLSIITISVIGYATLQLNRQVIHVFSTGERHFEDITTAATEVSSYVKRAEGHLLMYLVFNRKADKDKFPKRIQSLHQQISILDEKIENDKARSILAKIKASARGLQVTGNQLIAHHDRDLLATGKFDLAQHREIVFNLHEDFSTVRKSGVELAAFEIALENDLKLAAQAKAERLRSYMLILITGTSILALGLGYLLVQMTRRLRKEIARRQLSEENVQLERNKLQAALDEVKTMSGLLPICAACKKIRDDSGYWNQIENYIKSHSEAEFSHSICPECAQKLYPEFIANGKGPSS